MCSSVDRLSECNRDSTLYPVQYEYPRTSGGSGILSLAGNKISLNLRRQERNFRNPLVTAHLLVTV